MERYMRLNNNISIEKIASNNVAYRSGSKVV